MDYVFLKWLNSFAGQWEWLDILGLICAEYLIFAIPLIIVLIYFFSKNRKKTLSIILKIVLTLTLVYALTYLISITIARPRPFVNNNNEIYQLTKLFAKPTDFSFPSYHTATVFVLAFVVLLDWKKFGIILLIPALIVGLARIFAGIHYPLDILGGILIAFIGVVLINFILKHFKYGNT